MSFTLQRVRKQYLDGTHRAISPAETLLSVSPLMDEIGVEEVTDITPSDRIGIPCFSAYRPRAPRGGVRYHAGKGKDPVQAKVSAMMEAVEQYSAIYRMDQMEYQRMKNSRYTGRSIPLISSCDENCRRGRNSTGARRLTCSPEMRSVSQATRSFTRTTRWG